jgi:hypothetical protein
MPRVLTTNARILCPHAGVGTSTPPHPKWFIENGGMNGAVLVENDMGIIKGCLLLPVPCVSYQLKSMGLNATEVDGRKVILETDFNQTNTGLPLFIQEFHQTFDDSTVTPLPPGQTSQRLPPDLIDFLKPTVNPASQLVAFDSTTPPPPTLGVNFTLASDHPLKWVLILLNEPGGTHLDVTSSSPPGLTVAPSGGSWDRPVLTVNVTMSPPFLSGLQPGKYHFFMTAVSRRGLHGKAVADLHVLPLA